MTTEKRKKILIVDDEVGIRDLLSEILLDEGYAVATASDAASAHKAREREAPDLILLDVWMPDQDGVALMRQWAEKDFEDNAAVIVMSGHATIGIAVEATKLGAVSVLEKPITTDVLLSAIKKALIMRRPAAGNRRLQNFMMGRSPPIKKLKEDLLAAIAEPGPVLMVAPMNAGAVFFARYLVAPRKPVVSVTDAAQLEGEIKKLLSAAAGGLLIVPMAQALNYAQQNGLLGLLSEAVKQDTRVVVCSTLPPEELADASGFSGALIKALSRYVVTMPQMTKSNQDIADFIGILCQHFSGVMNGAVKQFTPAAVNLLTAHSYRNDFAEVMAIVRGCLMSVDGDTVDDHVVNEMVEQLKTDSIPDGNFLDEIFTMNLRDARELFERRYFDRLMAVTGGDAQQAAKLAGLDRTYFYRKIKQTQAGADK